MARSLSDRAQELLELVPPFMRSDPTLQGLVDAGAREVDRVEAAKDEVVANFWPGTAETYLYLLELLVGRAPAPADIDLATRRALVLSYLQLLKSSPQGIVWEQRLQQITSTVLTSVEQNDDQVRETIHDHFYSDTELAADWTYAIGTKSITFDPDQTYGFKETVDTVDPVVVRPLTDFSDRFVQVRTKAGSGNSDGAVHAIIKYVDANNYLGASIERANLRIWRVRGGSYSSLNNVAFTITTGRRYTLHVQAIASNVTLFLRYFNSSGVWTEDTLSQTLTGLDSTVLGVGIDGECGVGWTNLYPDWVVEDFKAGESGFNVDDYHLRVGVPPDDTALAAVVLAVLRDITPAHIQLETFEAEGFVLGKDQLGLDQL